MHYMHDWTLVSLTLEWEKAQLSLTFRNAKSANVSLAASGVSALNVPLMNPWGPSVSVNEVIGPQEIGDEGKRLIIEMQSGDQITVVANAFQFPGP